MEDLKEYRVDKKINPDNNYYGFKLRTRRMFHDSNIAKEVLPT